jgi:hypothetical protein
MNGYICSALDSAGTQCVSWIAVAGPFPVLSVSDAFTIAASFLGAWSLAYSLRYVARMLIR